jgi:hypothetical protein
LAANGNEGAKIYSGILFVSAIAFFILSIKEGVGGFSIFDKICLAVSLAGVVAWQVSKNPVLALWFVIVAYFIVYLPAFVKTWKHPYTESPWLYSLSALASLLSMITYRIEAVSVFQIFAIGNSLLMLLCIFHRGIPKAEKTEL